MFPKLVTNVLFEVDLQNSSLICNASLIIITPLQIFSKCFAKDNISSSSLFSPIPTMSLADYDVFSGFDMPPK